MNIEMQRTQVSSSSLLSCDQGTRKLRSTQSKEYLTSKRWLPSGISKDFHTLNIKRDRITLGLAIRFGVTR